MLADATDAGTGANNAEICAIHLARNQWREAGEPVGPSSAPILQLVPTISETKKCCRLFGSQNPARELAKTAFLHNFGFTHKDRDWTPESFCLVNLTSPSQWKLAQVIGLFQKR